jgi:hypothetical protein
VLVSLACARAEHAGREVEQALNPLAARDATVVERTAVGPYLLVALSGRGPDLRLLAPRDPVCVEMLAPEAEVTYRKHGVYGRFERDGAVCSAIGVASLAAWRDRQPRPEGRPVPRATVRFRVVHREGDLVAVRGRFPLAARVGIPAGYDLVALLPDAPGCEPLLARGEASMEFRDAGPDPFRLVSGEGPCTVLGFAEPVSERVP